MAAFALVGAEHPEAKKLLEGFIQNDGLASDDIRSIFDKKPLDSERQLGAALALGGAKHPEAKKLLEDVLRGDRHMDYGDRIIAAAALVDAEHPEAKKLLEGILQSDVSVSDDVRSIFDSNSNSKNMFRAAVALGPGNSNAKQVLEDVLRGVRKVKGLDRDISRVKAAYALRGANAAKHPEANKVLKDLVQGKGSMESRIMAAFVLQNRPVPINELLLLELFEINDLAMFRNTNIGSSPVILAPEQRDPTHGGIDFNPNNLELSEQGNQRNFDIPAVNLENMPSNITINGIQPVIINVTPVPNLYLLLGLNEDNEDQELSRL